jgi:hypothetical protein
MQDWRVLHHPFQSHTEVVMTALLRPFLPSTVSEARLKPLVRVEGFVLRGLEGLCVL